MTKQTIIEMYVSSNYRSWEEADYLGGVYQTIVDSTDPSIIRQVQDAIRATWFMSSDISDIELRTKEISHV